MTQADNGFVMYCIYHKTKYEGEQSNNFVSFGVNEIYPKEKRNENIIFEYELEKYNPFLQKRGYMETSVYLHVYWNQLHKNKTMIGFSQYDMKHNETYEHIERDKIYILNTGESIVSNQQWHHLMHHALRNIDYLIDSYNRFYNKNYSMKELENMPLSLWQTNIYPVVVYEKLCRWLEVLVEDIYPWSNEPPYESHFGSIGGYTERALSIFNAFEIYEGIGYNNLNIDHSLARELIREQYNTHSFLNKYSQDVHTKFIDNITTPHDSSVRFSMFKSECCLDDIYYSCERVNKHGRNGLYFKRDDWPSYREHAFDIQGEDPRIVILKQQVYVIFTCEVNYKHLHRGIAVTHFDHYNPILLKIRNDKFNSVEKNWAPFVKDDKLYFVYNYDPLVIIHYDFNSEGMCDIVFAQENTVFPINTSNKYLRGGSNFIAYTDSNTDTEYTNRYFIGGCHSRVHHKGIHYNTHIILLDTIDWKIVYISKPVMYTFPHQYLNKINGTDILRHESILPYHSNNLHIIQAPCSMYTVNGSYFVTVDINCHITLLYEIMFDIEKRMRQYALGEIERLTFEYNM
jgi:hypothetical protein